MNFNKIQTSSSPLTHTDAFAPAKSNSKETIAGRTASFSTQVSGSAAKVDQLAAQTLSSGQPPAPPLARHKLISQSAMKTGLAQHVATVRVAQLASSLPIVHVEAAPSRPSGCDKDGCLKTKPNGNCLFESFEKAYNFETGSNINHKELRKAVADKETELKNDETMQYNMKGARRQEVGALVRMSKKLNGEIDQLHKDLDTAKTPDQTNEIVKQLTEKISQLSETKATLKKIGHGEFDSKVYIQHIAEDKVWGNAPELLALSKLYPAATISIYQREEGKINSSPVSVFGEGETTINFLRHGNHYQPYWPPS